MQDDVLDIASLDALDEAVLAIRHPTKDVPTGWTWTFYGPAHQVTLELADRFSREALRKAASVRQAQVNGKKWHEDEQSPDRLRAENVDAIVARTKTFSPVKLNGEELSFSREKARELLLDPRKGWLLVQVMAFLRDEQNFMPPSATS
ncbi:branched-chain amino acid ABC transporter [Bradyrhizobium sp. Arg816]|uniref:branched-chain amino acid ABC transporter n=1 Tax=Bradyrhizobium sp. Arg816 TaxID=2998491 RepID=UPI00249DD267|nr:branched-chain amino acid ABC transporter [Bradyrhizobium sp. Arg816]MDI3559568.1 branched-chain amino acid ABC transporter [Bradyrhizobium sp. Arg816]